MFDYQTRGAVTPIPAEYLPILQNIRYTKGVSISWLAAVCERTGWDAAYKVMNWLPGRNSVRQFGLVGIWGDIPEIPAYPKPVGGWGWCYPLGLSNVGSGWFPWGFKNIWFQCACLPGNPNNLDVTTVLNLAADILKDCDNWVTGICGSRNALIYLRWQLGCHWLPTKDEAGNCVIPAGLPDVFKTEMDTLVEAQRLYAELLNEEPIVPPTPGPPGPPGPAGPGGLLVAGLAGLLGLLGLLGLAASREGKGAKGLRGDRLRQQAASLRQKASQLRSEAGGLRARGRERDAQRVETQAFDLERRATELEDQGRQLDFEASREEAERARRQAGIR